MPNWGCQFHQETIPPLPVRHLSDLFSVTVSSIGHLRRSPDFNVSGRGCDFNVFNWCAGPWAGRRPPTSKSGVRRRGRHLREKYTVVSHGGVVRTFKASISIPTGCEDLWAMRGRRARPNSQSTCIKRWSGHEIKISDMMEGFLADWICGQRLETSIGTF